uniref:Uncharacterized protein n=1 Tax=Maylandia zebra TaxID=106582 RepID=A0A3P9D2G5_9CICH
MLNVKEQRIYQATKPQYSLDTESGVLELTVLGACQCAFDTEPCPCSRTAAASRKQLVQLQQETGSDLWICPFLNSFGKINPCIRLKTLQRTKDKGLDLPNFQQHFLAHRLHLRMV